MEHRPRSVAVLAWLRLARVEQKLTWAGAEDLRRWQLSTAQFDILAHVGAAQGLTQRELARARLTTKGNLSQLLDHMETDGLVCRVRQGRTNRIYLTDTGRELFAAAVPAHEALIARGFDCLSPAEQRQLLVLLRRLDHALAAPNELHPADTKP